MVRFSKFKKRIKSLTIDGFDIHFSAMERPNHHHGAVELPFKLLYKKNIIFEFNQDNKKHTDLDTIWYGRYQVMDFIDFYFDLKHQDAFDKDVSELMELFPYEQKQTPYCGWWKGRFKELYANDLLTILKLCDRRVGRRSLQKFKDSELKPEFQQILQDRLTKNHK